MRRAAARPSERPELVVAEGQIGRQAPLQPQDGAVLEGELGGPLDRRERLATAMDDWAGGRGGASTGRAHRAAESGPRLGPRRAARRRAVSM